MPFLLPRGSEPKLTQDRRQTLNALQTRLGVRFKNVTLLNLALSHRSYANEGSEHKENNERLEFLGDSVLGLVVAEYLYQHLNDRPEGDLARVKSFVVSETSLAQIARALELSSAILVGRGEEFSGGRRKKAILADAMEAVIGAYFLDSGFKAARKFVLRYMVPEIDKVLEDRHKKDYKTLLQEHVQKVFKSYPRYHLVRKTGPDHDKTFWIQVEVDGKQYGVGQGKNKKAAEQAAAEIAYHDLAEDPGSTMSESTSK